MSAAIKKFVVDEFYMDTNSLTGFQYNSSCTYSKEGDCASCCERAMVLTP